MGMTFITLATLTGILCAAFSNVLSEEFKAWAPTIARWLLSLAVSRMPAGNRERYEEEWAAHINETPGDIGKIFVAAGTNIAAWKMKEEDAKYPQLRRSRLIPKRAFDIVISLSAIVALMPLFLLAVLAIRLDSRGPVIFSQPRWGKDGRTFKILKLRSMVFDPAGVRVTRVGTFLRHTAIDELPQLINILKGDMSFVGPRPHPIDLKASGNAYEKVVENYHERHRVRPGMTGLAQLLAPRAEMKNENKARARINADLEYIRGYSLLLDLKIILRTVLEVLLWRK